MGGASLLMLPKMTTMEGSMPFFDALFTSISASCVTGLIVVDTATYFTTRGQFIIMLLIQLGGLNIISFATLFALMARRSVGIKYQSIIKDNFNIGSINESKVLIKKVFQFSFFIEIIGAIIIFISWGDDVHFNNLREKIFNSLFHAVSAFNNGGFSTFSNGLFEAPIRHQNLLHITIAFLIILGATGFTVLHEVFSLRQMKEVINKPWKKLSVNSKISLNTTAVLLILGTVAYIALEQNNTLEGMNYFDQFTAAFFQSVTTRTAGFNTVDIGAIGVPMTIFMLMLMYIGASPASTGGGIKTNTFTVLFMSAYSTMRGKKTIDIDMKTIGFDSVNKALLIFLFSVSVIFISVFILTITDSDKSILDLAFEEVSAFATVGLTRGITSDLSTGGRIVIMISMFVGRVGLLTLGYALSKQTISSDYKYPKAKIIIG
jgi:potassium uptake TrkH family protein